MTANANRMCLIIGSPPDGWCIHFAIPLGRRQSAITCATSAIPPALALIRLHISDTLADAITLGFRDCREDREYELADTVASGVAAQVDHVQRDAAVFQILQHSERIEGGAEHAVKLGGNDHVAPGEPLPELAAFRTFGERDAARDAGLHDDVGKRAATLHGPAIELALLD